jgi:hypothetical protein
MSKTSRSRGLFVLTFVLTAGLLVPGACRKMSSEKASEKTAEKMMGNFLSKATGNKTSVDLSKGEIKVKTEEGDAVLSYGGNVWPNDLPEGTIKFEGGTIKGTTKNQLPNGTSWMVIVEKVAEDDVNEYIDELKNDGWEIQMTTATSGGAYTQAKKDSLNLTISYSKEEKTVGLSFILEKEG